MSLEKLVKKSDKKQIKKIVSGAIFTSLFVSQALATELQSNEVRYGVDAFGTTNDVAGIGAHAKYKNFTLGVGYLNVSNIKSKYGVKDKFNGGYATLEAKAKIPSSKLELFLDGTYIAGKTKDKKLSVDKGIIGGGVKYDINDNFRTFVGGTSENTVYAGIEKDLWDNWKFQVGGNRDYKNNKNSVFLGFTYNFGSGFSSNLVTGAAKSAVEGEYRKEFTKKYPSESATNPSGGSSGSGGGRH